MSEEKAEKVNTAMAADNTIHLGVNFEEKKERLMLKSLLTWVTIRFANAQGRKFEGTNLKYHQQLSIIEQMKKVAVISKSDAWIIEQNAPLFAKVARDFMKEFLNKELYDSYGGVLFAIDPKTRIADVVLIPPTRSGAMQEVAPCTMYIMDDSEIIKQYKDTESLVNDQRVDILPLLKIMITGMLEPRYNHLIDTLFDKYKNDEDVLEMRERIRARRVEEEENLERVLKAISVQGSRVQLAKMAIVLHTIISASYNSGPNLITKLRFEKGGSTIPVMDYSRAFTIDFMDTLEPLKEILAPILPTDIKIRIKDKTILFTTGNVSLDNESDMATVMTANVANEEALNYMFENHIAPTVSIDEVSRVMNRVLFQKYKNDYF